MRQVVLNIFNVSLPFAYEQEELDNNAPPPVRAAANPLDGSSTEEIGEDIADRRQ
jgi:hypothetical protein